MNNNISLVSSIIIALAMSVFASCTTLQNYTLYEGPQLPDDKVAYLVSKGNPILIHSVDGKKNPSGEDTYGPGRLAVLPGYHTLTVSFYSKSYTTQLAGHYYYEVFHKNTSTSNVDVSVKTEPGREYFLTSEYDYKELQWNFVVIDKANNEKIIETGPYTLNRVRTGDNRAIRRQSMRGR